MPEDRSGAAEKGASGTTTAARVLYIGGLERSGSTLLDRMLGQVPGFVSTGEIRELWEYGARDNALCGCGIPFRECPFWKPVGSVAFGGWDRLDPSSVMDLAGSVDRHRYVPFLAARGPGAFERRVAEYTDVLQRLYRAIRTVSGGQVIVDSSKAPSTAFVLRRVPGLDLRAIHLVRDPRGVAFSWTKRVVRPDVVTRTEYMDRYEPYQMGMRWVTRNLLMESLGRLGVPALRVGYERVVTDPRGEMERILAWAGRTIDPKDLSFIADGRVHLGLNHTVMGNPVRMKEGPLELRLDEEWRTSMDRSQQRLVTGLTWPLLRRYGYGRTWLGRRPAGGGERP